MVKEMWIAQCMYTETKATEQNPRMRKRMQKHKCTAKSNESRTGVSKVSLMWEKADIRTDN